MRMELSPLGDGSSSGPTVGERRRVLEAARGDRHYIQA